MKKLDIIYEDKDIIVVNKPSNLLTIATAKERIHTLYHEVLEYEKKKYPKNKIFIVHRLDKDTSGIVLLAKNSIIKHKYQDNWDKLCKLREYTAIVEGRLSKKKERIISYITETKTFLSYSTDNKSIGKLAITDYEVIKENKSNTVLKIHISTGRKNQIRVHMQDIHHSILGDKKYGSNTNFYRRMALHANKLVIVNPITNKEMTFESRLPKEFNYYIETK